MTDSSFDTDRVQWVRAESTRIAPRYSLLATTPRVRVHRLDDRRILKLTTAVGAYGLAGRESLPGAAPVHAVAQVGSDGFVVVQAWAEPPPERWRTRELAEILRPHARRPRSQRRGHPMDWIQSAAEAVELLAGAGLAATDVKWSNWGTLDGRAVLVDLGQPTPGRRLPPVPMVHDLEDVLRRAEATGAGHC